MKRVLLLLIAILLTAALLSGCRSSGDQPEQGSSVRIVASIFPEYDWVRNILGENPGNISLTLLMDSGVDLHSFQPSATDILTVTTCDLLVYPGGESDKWIDDALKALREGPAVLDLLEILGEDAKEEAEGVEGNEEEEEETEYDEHVWLSLRNAAVFVQAAAEAICRLDPAHAETYRSNAAAYTAKLNALDAQYRDAVANAPHSTLLFGDRFPFRYLTEDYGLTYFAAFSGCSAETEASFRTIAFLAQKVDELSLPAVITIEGSDCRIADTIVQNTRTKDQKILVLDSMQAVTAGEIAGGTTYLSIMEKNLSVLKEALH